MTTPEDLELVKPEKISSPLWKEDDLTIRDEFIGFPISLKRLAITITCCYLLFELHYIYMFAWRAMHFRYFIRSGTSGNFLNILCSLFFPISFFKLAAVYNERAESRGIKLRLHKYILPTAYLLIYTVALAVPICCVLTNAAQTSAILDRLMPILKLLSLFVLIPVFIFQHKVNQLNHTLLPDKIFSQPPTRLEEGAVVFCVVVGIAYRALSGQF